MKRLNFTQLGKSRKFFNTTRYETPDPALKLFSGYQANFLLADKGIYLRVDPAKKIVRKERVLDAINTVYAEHKEKDRQEKRNCVREAFVGKTVMTNYGKARYIRIDDILFENVDTQCLPGTETTLRKFYEEKYSIKIENARQPLLVVKDKRKPEPDLMVPQLCLMTGIPDSFDEFKRKKISESTIKSPAEKKKEIDTLIKDVSTDNHLKSLKQLGIDLSFQMEKIKAKSIQNPTLQLG